MAKNDILLVYPIPSFDSPVNLVPLSILFPGAFFESRGMKVAYFDERFDTDEMLDELIKDSNEIGVSAFTGPQCGRAANILIKAKEINPSIITGIGGHHARILPGQVLAEPFVEKIWTEPSYGENLFPYHKGTKKLFERSDMQYFTSRGCPHSCSFCSLSSDWQPKDIQDLDRELSIMHDDIGFQWISFSDPNIAFGASENERLERIRQVGKIMRKLHVRWDGNLRSPYLSSRMVEALCECNCCSIEVGCESGNDYFLKKVIRKGHGTDAIKKAALSVRGSGISVMYSFMAYMPRETKAMLMDTFDLIDWIVSNDPKARVSIFTYAPFPGSKMYEDAVEGVEGYPRFVPPTTLNGWAQLPLMKSPLYWIAGLCFRKDNTRRNFRGSDWILIEPYVRLAEGKWKKRDFEDFPCHEVEELILKQMIKNETVRDIRG